MNNRWTLENNCLSSGRATGNNGFFTDSIQTHHRMLEQGSPLRWCCRISRVLAAERGQFVEGFVPEAIAGIDRGLSNGGGNKRLIGFNRRGSLGRGSLSQNDAIDREHIGSTGRIAEEVKAPAILGAALEARGSCWQWETHDTGAVLDLEMGGVERIFGLFVFQGQLDRTGGIGNIYPEAGMTVGCEAEVGGRHERRQGLLLLGAKRAATRVFAATGSTVIRGFVGGGYLERG